MTNQPLLMGCTIADLRRKLADPESPLAPWWQHFLRLARRDPEFFSPYTVLAALVTGEAGDRELARQSFLRFVEMREEGLISNDTQYHTHVIAAPLGRWAIFYDWIADEGILAPAEQVQFCDYLLDYAMLFPWQQIASRARMFENQSLSNAFGAAVVGYLLGCKRGSSATGRNLWRAGRARLEYMLANLPVGGYSPEGSTYHECVVLPMVLLSALFVAEATGQPVSAEVRRLLETSCRMIGPAGLMPAWDAYGFQPASVKSGLAYLAKITRNPAPLQVLRDCDLWYRTTLPGWELDDRLWALVWWPADLEVPPWPARFPPWMEPEIGGALQSAAGKVRLFQCWDECGGVPTSGRAQVNPNAITLEAFGSPLLIDGSGNVDKQLNPIPPVKALAYAGQRRVESVQEYLHASWGGHPSLDDALAVAFDGNVGLSNSLILDGENWFVPLAPRHGTGEVIEEVGPLQVIRSDATEYYRDRYDVRRVSRASMLVDGRYVLVTDRVRSESPHPVTWQAFLRPVASAQDGRVTIRTAEQVHCDLIPLQQGSLDLVEISGFPRLADNRSVRFRHTLLAGRAVRLDVALVPQPGTRVALDLTADWERDIAGQTDRVLLADAFLTDRNEQPETPRVYRRTFSLQRQPGRRHFVRVNLCGNGVAVQINGQPTSATTAQYKGHWPGSAEHLPWVFDVTDAVRNGDNEIVLTAPFFHGESVGGPVQLLVEEPPQPVRAERTGPDSFRVRIGSREDQLLMDHEGGRINWAGGKTDARYAVLTADRTVAAAQVRHLSLPGMVEFSSDEPRNLVWTPAEGLCVLESPAAAELKGFTVPASLPASESSEPIRRKTGTAPRSVEEVYQLEGAPVAKSKPLLLEALQSGDWRVQVAVADLVGRLGIREAVPQLLNLFAEAERELPYPPLRNWWRASKMLRGPDRTTGPDPSVPLPIGVKRWRLKRAVVTALGMLGDPRAVGPLEAALKRCDDFFPVTSQLPVALGRLGSPTSIPILERHLNHAEINTRVHARLALALLKGEVERTAFEQEVNL